jgi:steroid delta-isomerase
MPSTSAAAPSRRSPRKRGRASARLRAVTGEELLEDNVRRFNQGVRSGDFGSMLELFTEDASLEFVGVPVGPFQGREAIAAAYRDRPPDDEIEVIEASESGADMLARYAWLRDEDRAAGDLRLTRDGDRIARLVVTFDAAA